MAYTTIFSGQASAAVRMRQQERLLRAKQLYTCFQTLNKALQQVPIQCMSSPLNTLDRHIARHPQLSNRDGQSAHGADQLIKSQKKGVRLSG